MQTFAEDFTRSLWTDSCLQNRQQPGRWLLRQVRKKTLKKFGLEDMDHLLDVLEHCDVMPFRYAVQLNTRYKISEKQEAMVLAEHYYPSVRKLIMYLTNQKKNTEMEDQEFSDTMVMEE